MTSSLEKLTHINSTLRSLLQACSIVSLEIIRRNLSSSEQSDFDYLASRFHQPADGLPGELLDKATPLIRSFIYPDFLRGWYEATPNFGSPLISEIIEWVEFRNKVLAHGVTDQGDIRDWTPKAETLLKKALSIFSNSLPVYTEGSAELVLPNHFENLRISTPLVYNSKAVVISKITSKKGIWKLLGQQLCWENAAEFLVDLPRENVFSEQGFAKAGKFNCSTVICNGSPHTLFQNIPSRQTSIFEGRSKELEKLKAWINEPEESKSCLIYGDGGYGKTTLALEFLNQILDGRIELNAPPEIISYYTAKMTKWTDQGIVHFRGISGAMGDGIRELIYCLQDVLGKDWYKVEGTALIDKVQQQLKEQGYKRDDVLLVLDNTETLTSSTSDNEELEEFFNQVVRKIGRVIVTSRRRELLNATPIQVARLSDFESTALMRRLAKEYGAKPILQAGDNTLRKAGTQLMQKPLLIDALVRYIARTAVGIDEALTSILRKTNDQLLEFLYEDAWLRMTQGQRTVFLVLVAITCPADEFSIGHACQEVGIPHDEFILSLDETYFANQTKQGSTYELEIVELAKRFFSQKLAKLTSTDREEIMNYAAEVDRYAREREAIDREYKKDRVAEAFKGPYAKAAKIASEKGKISEAKEFYELAIQDDPLNSALHDRFAWFLLNKAHKLELAFIASAKAVELNDKNADALLTHGIILYHKNDIENGDKFISKANREGKSESVCLLRMGIGRYHYSKSINNRDAAIKIIEESIDLFDRSRHKLNSADKYYAKNSRDLQKYIALSQQLLHDIKMTKGILLSEVIKVTDLGGFDRA
ncbi:Hypothetical protein, contains NB-ARC domain [Cupriavidus necator H16]|nr:Hypothetical protein, contains NB-ARC domain [Cupriavidus necator H16]